MTLADTGPLVALANPADQHHRACVDALSSLNDTFLTTVPVLTEAVHLLSPGSTRVGCLLEFLSDAPIEVWHMDDPALARSFDLMLRYADAPMDLADASLVVCAEVNSVSRVFTLDLDDFSTYRIKRGHRHVPFEVIP